MYDSKLLPAFRRLLVASGHCQELVGKVGGSLCKVI